MMETNHRRRLPPASQARKITWWVARYLLILLAWAFFLFPICWVISTSLKPPDEIFHIPVIFVPNEPTLYHYFRAFGPAGGGRALLQHSALQYWWGRFFFLCTVAANVAAGSGDTAHFPSLSLS